MLVVSAKFLQVEAGLVGGQGRFGLTLLCPHALMSSWAGHVVIYKINGSLAGLHLLILADVFTRFTWIQALAVVLHQYCMQHLHLGRKPADNIVFGSESAGSSPDSGWRRWPLTCPPSFWCCSTRQKSWNPLEEFYQRLASPKPSWRILSATS